MDYVSVFSRQESGPGMDKGEYLVLPEWGGQEWRKLFAATTSRPFKAGEFVIQHGIEDRSVFFVAAGSLEIGVTYLDGVSINLLAKIGPGSVVGEQSFFDGRPRSANVWAITDGELLCLTQEKFRELADTEPKLVCGLLLALSRILSLRLRYTTFRVRN